jgi:hypothetical protein
MPQWLLGLIGVLGGLVVLAGVIYLATKPPRRGARSWLAPPSGKQDVPPDAP